MQTTLKIIFLSAVMILTSAVAFAEPYPATLDNGNWVCVDGGMGVGKYADRSSVVAEFYSPPNYRIAIDIIYVTFSDDYWRNHQTYIGGPYKVSGSQTLHFRYHWVRKALSYLQNGTWLDWDINHDYSHAEGAPLIPYAAEVAFVSAYNMKFFGDTTGYSPVLKGYRRVIDENLYRALGM